MAQSEGGQALDELLGEARRTLQPWQRETVLAHFERCGLPLYLKLAAEESRLWKSYALEDDCRLGEGVAGVIDTLFDRLASNANHGPVLVERSLGYLAAARYGLAEDEVLDVLTEDDTVWNDFDQRKHHEVSERRLPVVVWSRLSLDLEPYLTDCQFMFAKVAAGMVLDLDADYAALLREDLESSLTRHEALGLIHGAVRLSMHVVAQDPAQFASQMVGRLLAHHDKPEVARFVDEIAAAAHRPWLRALHPCLDPSGGALLRALASHSGDVFGVAVTPDGRRAVSASQDKTLKVWDLASGVLERTLEGHSGGVNGVAVTPEGRQAVSASWDHTLKVWDLASGSLERTLEGHSDAVAAVAITPDGRQAVSASGDRTLKVWDLASGSLERTLEGHSDVVNAVAITPAGRPAVSGGSF
ncbi:MAG: WD40 repeat domain-containing protein [Terriglobia bacterium]